jgi:2-polyprenyl-6-methoxyphenol hydroxylase-like FAD-dependent oxidoreductase
MAIEDAACLAACGAASEDAVAALRRYEALRKKRTAATTVGAGLIGSMGQWSHPTLVAARTLFLKAFPTALWERQLKSLYAHRIDLA